MRKRILSVIFGIALALPLVSVTRDSIAGACVCEIPCKAGCCKWCEIWSPDMIAALSMAAAKNIASITLNVSAMVTWFEVRIVPTWAAGFGKVMAEKQRQTASLRVFKEGNAAVASQLYMQEQTAAAAERAVLPANLTTTVTNGAMLGEQTSIVRSKVGANNAAFMADFYAKNSADPGVVIERHKPYCSQVDVERARCDKAVSPTMQNADLMVNTVLNPGEGQYETLADEERDAARAFVKNVVNPVPVGRFSAAQAGSAQAKAYEAALLADQAALSLAAHSFSAIIGNRTRRHQQ